MHVYLPIVTGRGVGTETCEVDNVFTPDDLWFGSHTYTNGAVLHNLYSDVEMMGYVICIHMPYWWGRNGLRWPALSGHWLSCGGYWLHLLSMKWLMCVTLFLYISTCLGCFCPWTIFTKHKRIGKLPRTSSIGDLHTILRIVSRGVPRLATDCPSGCGWTTWLLHDGELFGLYFKLSVDVKCWYGGKDISLDFLPLLMFHILPKFCLSFLLSNHFTLR